MTSMEIAGSAPLTLFSFLLFAITSFASVTIGALLALHFVRYSNIHMTVLTVGVYTAGCIVLLAVFLTLVLA